MKLIVGLGNPGEEYENTRHNIGFAAIEGFRFQVLGVSNWKFDKKLKAEIAKGEIDGEKIILAKPQTFMNNSGQAVKLFTTHYKLPTNNLWIIHDDLDLPLGAFKISFAAGSAGHNGVQSIIDALKTKEFWRLRVGIGPKIGAGEKFVLKPFKKTEQSLLNKTLEQVAEALLLALKDPKKAMSLYNK